MASHSNIETDLKEGNDDNFGPNKLLYFLDVSLVELVNSLQLQHSVTSSVYKNLFEKEVTLSNDKPDNFTEILVKYKSAQGYSDSVAFVKKHCTLLKLNQELMKLNGALSNIAATKIADFIKKIVYETSRDYFFEIEVDQDDFYLSLTVSSPRELQSLVIEIF